LIDRDIPFVPWDSFARHFNKLIQQKGKGRQTRMRLINPKTGRRENTRVYHIPVSPPSKTRASMKPDPYARGRQRQPHAERAFVPEITFSNVDEMKRALGLPSAKPKASSMRAALLANLVLAAYGGNKGLHYSRDKNHYALERYWSTGVGCRLQRIDGDMCASIQRRCREFSIPCLSVHDSFIVPARHHELLKQLMNEELERALCKMKISQVIDETREN
jgi:hypothetical protein